MSHLTYAAAIVVGLFQGVTELFPVSSLGHSVLIPALIGGQWARDLNVSAPQSPYLAFIVGLHVATAAALLAFVWRDWVRSIGGLFTSVRDRQVQTPDERLAWMLILATIPVGISGLALEHLFRTVLGKPIPAAIFLTLNGLILYGGERLRRRVPPSSGTPAGAAAGAAGAAGQTRTATLPATGTDLASDRRLARLRFGAATLIGAAQILALLPGISRSGVTMVAGLVVPTKPSPHATCEYSCRRPPSGLPGSRARGSAGRSAFLDQAVGDRLIDSEEPSPAGVIADVVDLAAGGLGDPQPQRVKHGPALLLLRSDRGRRAVVAHPRLGQREHGARVGPPAAARGKHAQRGPADPASRVR